MEGKRERKVTGGWFEIIPLPILLLIVILAPTTAGVTWISTDM